MVSPVDDDVPRDLGRDGHRRGGRVGRRRVHRQGEPLAGEDEARPPQPVAGEHLRRREPEALGDAAHGVAVRDDVLGRRRRGRATAGGRELRGGAQRLRLRLALGRLRRRLGGLGDAEGHGDGAHDRERQRRSRLGCLVGSDRSVASADTRRLLRPDPHPARIAIVPPHAGVGPRRPRTPSHRGWGESTTSPRVRRLRSKTRRHAACGTPLPRVARASGRLFT